MQQKIKDWIKGNAVLAEAWNRTHRYLYGDTDYYLTERIGRLLEGKQGVYFVQVGSNDGKQNDPFHRLIASRGDWAGIFIEPVRHVFQRLQQNYRNEGRFVFENIAIGTEAGYRKFYYVSERARAELGDRLPDWYDQLGSFDRNHILKHLSGQLEPFIVEEVIQCLTLQQVLDRNQVKRLDLLHIDTEGFDYQVLSQVDFERYSPHVVLYEHRHLSEHEQRQAAALLTQFGYSLQEYRGDTLAVRQP